MTIFWTFWLIFIIVSFATIEVYAISTGGTTLSRYVWNLSRRWPPLGWVVGLLTGFVASHFWWGGGLICY